jgi:LDH2 family malate/lactate/ureidoglycolate dehydrogenase
VSAYLQELRDSPTAPGADGVRVPGDRMREERERRSTTGIPYPDGTWRRLTELQRSVTGRAF